MVYGQLFMEEWKMTTNLPVTSLGNISVRNPVLTNMPAVSVTCQPTIQGAISFNVVPMEVSTIDLTKDYSDLTLAYEPKLPDVKLPDGKNLDITPKQDPKFIGEFEYLERMAQKFGISQEEIDATKAALNEMFPSKNDILYFKTKPFGANEFLNLNIQIRNSDGDLRYGHNGDLNFVLPLSGNNQSMLMKKILKFATTLKENIK